MKVEYDSNNSGGDWWLTDQDWLALEQAGWKVRWFRERREFSVGEDSKWLGALADAATRTGLSLKEAVSEWERITGKCSTDAGCQCCGPPHRFTLYDDDGKYLDSGPNSSYGCSW